MYHNRIRAYRNHRRFAGEPRNVLPALVMIVDVFVQVVVVGSDYVRVDFGALERSSRAHLLTDGVDSVALIAVRPKLNGSKIDSEIHKQKEEFSHRQTLSALTFRPRDPLVPSECFVYK